MQIKGTSFPIILFCEFVGTEASSTAEEDAAWYERYKLVHGIADGPEIANRIPLECNLDLLHYISFHKGCYVGQELTARTKFKVQLRVYALCNFVHGVVHPHSKSNP